MPRFVHYYIRTYAQCFRSERKFLVYYIVIIVQSRVVDLDPDSELDRSAGSVS
jgi:hypothetical protein